MLAGTTDPNVAGSRQTVDEAIAEANSTGRLKNLSVFYNPNQGQAASGENAFVTLSLKAKATDGTSPIKLEGVEMINLDGEPFAVSSVAGEVVVQTGAIAPTPVPPPVAEGSGTTTGGTTSGTTNRVAGATAGRSTGTTARTLPRSGFANTLNSSRSRLFALGIVLSGAGVALLASNKWARRARRESDS
jgi:hypothetical protein